MSCDYPTRRAKPAPIWHRVFCRECRAALSADQIMAFAIRCRRAEAASYDAMGQTLTALGLPHRIPRPRRNHWARMARRLLRAAATLIVGGGFGLFAWTRYIDLEPNINIPSETIQGPNAYVDFKRAAFLIKDVKVIDDMVHPAAKSQPISQPAQTQGRMGGGGLMISPGMPANQTTGAAPANTTPEPHVYTLAEKKALLTTYGDALDAVKIGLGKPYQSPPIRSFDTLSPLSHAEGTRLARLLWLRAQVEMEENRWNDAAEHSLEAIEYATRIQQHGGTMEKMTGLMCEAIGRAPLWKAVDHLDVNQANSALFRLKTIIDNRVPVVESLKEQKWISLSCIQSLMRQPGWRLSFNSRESEPIAYAEYVTLLPYTKSRIMADAAKYLDGQIRKARQPYDRYSMTQTSEENTGDPISMRFLPLYQGIRPGDMVSETQSRLLIAKLAIHIFRLRNNRLPVTLAEVMRAFRFHLRHESPLSDYSFLDNKLNDPFLERNLLEYHLTKAGYILYSVGPDGQDNGGTPITSAGNDPEKMYIQSDSNGDIVAGVSGR